MKSVVTVSPKMKWYEALVIVCVLLHSVLDIYAFNDSFTFGNIADIIVFVLSFLGGAKNKIPTPLWWYIGYRVLVSFFSFGSLGSVIPFGFLLQVMALVALFRVANLDNFIKIYRILGVILSVFLIIQYFALALFDVRINGILEFLPIAIGGGDEFLYVYSNRDRPSSIFSEPAHFAEFILPLLCLELLDDDRKKSLTLIILCFASLLLSMSGTAIVGLLIIGVSYLKNLLSFQAGFKRIIWVVLLIASLPIAYYYYSRSFIGGMVLERTEMVVDASRSLEVSSEYVRIFRGYDIFGELDISEKIFGCGNKDNIINSIKKTTYSSMFSSENFYFNGIATILLYTGLIGLFLYIMVFVSIWRDNTYCGKSLVILLIALMAIASILISAAGATVLFLACAYKKSAPNKLIKTNTLTE